MFNTQTFISGGLIFLLLLVFITALIFMDYFFERSDYKFRYVIFALASLGVAIGSFLGIISHIIYLFAGV